MVSVSSVQSTDYVQQARDAEQLRAARQTPTAEEQREPPPPPPADKNLGSNLDVTA